VSHMRIYADPAELQAESLSRRARGQRVGLVPTMGALHRGHLSLMERLRPLCDWLVVSIYVNPLQFGPTEDLSRYPRDPEGDAALCASAGVDAILMPPTLYPPGHRTRVTVSGLTEGLCGASRPGHFEGVTTVVARLFGLVLPHVAIFGEKDYQQLAVLRRMTADLALPIEVLGGALVRDHDGLALSSRNVYLSAEERRRALSIPRALAQLQAEVAAGQRDCAALIAAAVARLEVDRLDYLEIREAQDLQLLAELDRPARALLAAHVGRTRLLDNVALPVKVGGEESP
jgi:pantoate--beta-alanine ligase